jgi:hypothetical protein
MSDQYPRGKLCEGDQGALNLTVSIRDKTVVIDFGKDLSWIGMPREQAISFANMILAKANQL